MFSVFASLSGIRVGDAGGSGVSTKERCLANVMGGGGRHGSGVSCSLGVGNVVSCVLLGLF